MLLKEISGVGKTTLSKLNALNITSIEDVLLCFPKKYEINKLDDISSRKINTQMMFSCQVISKPKLFYIRKRLTKLSFQCEINTFKFQVSIFNREFLSHSLNVGVFIVVSGKFLKNFNNFTASNLVLLENFKEGIKPIYGINDITEHRMTTIVSNILQNDYNIDDNIPEFIKNEQQFSNINKIITSIHQPKSLDEIQNAKKRLIYEEFLRFGIRIELIKKLNSRITSPKKNYDINIIRNFIKKLPFELTNDQKQATNEIFLDFKKSTRMNRLLQGDVGSGKTIVSVIAAYAIITAKYQVAILAPTLVLANQHYATFKKFLDSENIQVELLTSDITAHSRRNILNNVKSGKTNIIIGTHSLLQGDIVFNNLGFVVIDEQQRFGVEQRRIIREKGINPDILMMTATPIPRTLAISLFENTDVSSIKEKPSNRQNIRTEVIGFEDLEKAYKTIEDELNKSHQVYVICPLIEESETKTAVSVEEAYKMIVKRFITAKSDILHGKLNDSEKTLILNQFLSNKTQILVSTTVVEVGVNVPNATTMVIFNANSFGLAQIHQLRGRVGRNDLAAYCYLVVDNISDENDRLNILEKTNDGFEISEYDLATRGPGEVFGKTQSGIPNFKFANLINDVEVREKAFLDAKRVIDSNDFISRKLTNACLKSIESYNLD
ncbi:MAG: ATP-dependent DNA helicase RecG [Tenericutes bacterium HGW-Tenericutes-5]|jgi:ATP-dependent DNA helicase RecG|nr:MAG: ATP-dependent DNA helicase RecG [Tenericutes bacterium HGW-Tenericutes-5]